MSPYQTLGVRPFADREAVLVAYEREMAAAVAAKDGIRQLDLTEAYHQLTQSAPAETIYVVDAPLAPILEMRHRHEHYHRHDGRSFVNSLFAGVFQDSLTRYLLIGIVVVCLVGQALLVVLTMR